MSTMPTSAGGVRVSVVIGFKDWGVERLELSIRSIQGSLGMIPHEVVIADYGSEDPTPIADVAAATGARHEIVDTDGEWSRSRALNSGVRAARGEIILATDADMIFSPRALARVVEQLDRHPQEIVILQCRDLPVGFSHERVREVGFDWDLFASIGQIRPRWGMGGLVGVSRAQWNRLRGWDERMHTYGGEDIDFGKRSQYSGARIDWLDEPGVAMYHIWHPSSGKEASRSPAAVAAIAENRRIHTSDPTFARNLVSHRYLPADLPPVLSVFCFADGADDGTVERTVASLLGQSVHDVEVLLVGGDAERFDDPRVVNAEGLISEIRGEFCAQAVPGDIWLEDRAEVLLSAWEHGFGLISDFKVLYILGHSGELIDEPEAVRTTVPISSATVVRTRVVAGLDDTISDWSEIVRSAALTGARWKIHPLARVFAVCPIALEEPVVRALESEADRTAALLRQCGLGVPESEFESVGSLGALSRSLRDGMPLGVHAHIPAARSTSFTDLTRIAGGGGRVSEEATWDGEVVGRVLNWSGTDAVAAVRLSSRLRRLGAECTLQVTPDEAQWFGQPFGDLERLERVYGTPSRPHPWIVFTSAERATLDSVRREAFSMPGFTAVVDRVVRDTVHGEEYRLFVRSSTARVEAALVAASSFNEEARVIALPAAAKGGDAS